MNPQHILVLEPDSHFAGQLIQALREIDDFSISAVSTVKEACLQLVEARKDLAFIPIHEGAKIIRSLRAIQPDLRLILVTPTADFVIPITYSGRVQGVLIKELLNFELRTILKEALQQPFFIRETNAAAPAPIKTPLDTAVLVSAIHRAELGQLIQTVIVSCGSKLLAYWGDLNERESATVALHIGRNWSETQQQTRIQFMHLPARAGDLLLYTQQIINNHLLTLVALPETPVSKCRRQAEKLRSTLLDIIKGKIDFATDALATVAHDHNIPRRISYVIVWRPIEPLADSLQTPLRQALLRLATTNGCVLTHIHIQATLIHLVVTCPYGRDTNWAAYLFKSGSEQIIQQEYGVVVSLWEPGHYATESTEPLSLEELNIFLNQSL